MSKSALTGGLIFSVIVPLTDSMSTRAVGVSSALTSMSPDTVLDLDAARPRNRRVDLAADDFAL